MLLFKIDFDKAYDNVNWEFLLSVLDQMDFPSVWCEWIRGILVSARFLVLVNGSPTFEFGCQKGIRQGDPISPFLFIILMEAFSGLMNKACDIGAFDGIRLPNDGSVLSHLLYADDAIVGVDIEELKIEADSLGCKAGDIPFVYLGIKVGANMNRISNWDPVVNTFKRRLSKWKANTLSIGSRVTLIKSGGSDDVRKMSWVSWDVVTKPIRDGGLGISRLEMNNIALIGKWLWRFYNEQQAMWRRVIVSIHGSSRSWGVAPVNNSITGGWKNCVTFWNKYKVVAFQREFGTGYLDGARFQGCLFQSARNEEVFSSKEPNVVEMIADIKTLGFLWYKYRFKGKVVDWDQWCSFDLM
ncbi:uncharacterized protein LOC110906495 [Helianthus annuus]|uniref:uncharacterized protein LOC110906495 n=1 Tax=Helianthus annuus TaxID=4232 RepID=UPI000B90A480|nr:uncharacterized protein LOC110906495 [Helianthus annuus]